METYKDHIIQSPDMNAERLETLRNLFPDWFTQEGQLDINEVKKAVNPNSVDETERYEFRWFGKSNAKRNAFMPTRATLHYDETRSVNPEATENVIIEGENLEVLKILLNGYRNKIKVIYIDPPYNTGEDFLYNDNFSEGRQAYWERTEQSEDGITLDTNSDASGRFHSNWLDMMYSRLLVARNLLRPDGVIFISMDDHEIHHLCKLCAEVFGEENFVAQFVWEKRVNRENRKEVSSRHDYILCFSKETIPNVKRIMQLPMNDKALSSYGNPDNDPRGLWKSDPAHAQGGHGTKSQFYTLIAPNGKQHNLPSGRCWAYTQPVMEQAIKENRIWFGKDGNGVPRIKTYLNEKERGLTPESIIFARDASTNEQAKEDLKELFNGVAVFDTPKPVELLTYLLGISVTEGIVLDFFAGSGVVGHASMVMNMNPSNNIKYILVQIPEALDKDCDAFKVLGYKTISDITINRTLRAGQVVANEASELMKVEQNEFNFENKKKTKMPDTGFKVFKLCKSSFPRTDFAPDPEKSEEENLNLFRKYVSEKEQQLSMGFDGHELITEILISRGFMLTYKLELQPSFTENTVYLASDGTKEAYICVDNSLADSTVDYFMQNTDIKFICIERALDSTKKFNLKKKMGDKFFAF